MANANGELSVRLRKDIPKLREIARRNRKESDTFSECTELDFEYSDQDTLVAEISELYSYSEERDIEECHQAFTEFTEKYLDQPWTQLDRQAKICQVRQLIDWLDMADCVYRSYSAQCILYLVQGCYAECDTLEESLHWSRENVFLLYECGLFPALIQVLNLQMFISKEFFNSTAESINDSREIRLPLNILYTLMLVIHSTEEAQYKALRDNFLQEISEPILGYANLGLFMLTLIYFYEKGASFFPIKKLVLLFWKYTLFTLGGLEDLEALKRRKREEAGLAAWHEPKDTVQPEWQALQPQYPEKVAAADQAKAETVSDDDELVPQPAPTMEAVAAACRRLPWRPKARQKDIELYLSSCRNKFLGYHLPGDTTTMVGLPDSIIEGVRILQDHQYVSLGDLAMEHEEKMYRTPARLRTVLFYNPPAETLYKAMLPKMQDYIISLLKVLLASATTQLNKGKSGNINVLLDVLPEEVPQGDACLRLEQDLTRHKEIITKAVSAVLLLLLKHYRLNHTYQFEYISQCMVYANCIPLVLKFLNQDMAAYITSKDNPQHCFPANVFSSGEGAVEGEGSTYCWRNMFASINMLRLVQKLTKWRPPRTMMLHVFKSAPILKRALKVSNPLIQLYVLKLLKIQTKYLGKTWRKANMKTLSLIYQHVRHRLLDDWAYGNDLDSRQWEYPTEEQQLKLCLDLYHSMWYSEYMPALPEPDLPVLPEDQLMNNDLHKVLAEEVELPKGFERGYKAWLKREVYDKHYDWDSLLDKS